jgi:hypothetical protein
MRAPFFVPRPLSEIVLTPTLDLTKSQAGNRYRSGARMASDANDRLEGAHLDKPQGIRVCSVGSEHIMTTLNPLGALPFPPPRPSAPQRDDG